MATSTPSMNGRKSLASQIDRLDGILDGLAEGLYDAVAMLVKEAVTTAVKESVQAVLTELLTNPAVMAKIHAPQVDQEQSEPKEPKPTIRERLSWVWNMMGAGCNRLLDLCKPVANVAAVLIRFRQPILIALIVGLLCGVGGKWLSVLLGGVGVLSHTLIAFCCNDSQIVIRTEHGDYTANSVNRWPR